ncbi:MULTISPECIES: hypothetical protein [Bacillus subtilis group]|uniref:hypothetical protein n=1 Tax=Bacillus subtilis group TaxID=653685 RepID=UPI0021B41417|nr:MULTISPECIES: hypothetical protein [Bacillus subtilis group]MCY8228687.1 hypothetical protein [Bacillus spizizenii]MEC2335108.1 hypothetical protein [Bacillus subtilis]
MTSKMIQKQKQGKSAIQKLSEYKTTVLNRVIESDTLSKLLFYDKPDALSQKSLTEDERLGLLHTRVYPYRFVPQPTETQTTYLTLGVNGFRRNQEAFKIYDDYQAGEIYFYLFTHVDLMRTNHGVRQDLMLGEMDRLFEGFTGIGMGELKLRYATELWMHNNKFGGYSIGFTVVDFK